MPWMQAPRSGRFVPPMAVALLVGGGLGISNPVFAQGPLTSSGGGTAGTPAAPPGGNAAAGKDAQGTTKQCVAAYEDGQRLRKDSRLVAARERLLQCAQESCPAVLSRDCAQWVGEVEQSMPTVVFEAKTPDGRDIFDVRVMLDDRPLLSRLDGRAVPLDPGPHVFRFETYGRNAVEERLLALEGEKNRRVIVHFGEHAGARERDSVGESSKPSPGLAVQPRGVPASVLVFGAIGGAGVGAFAGFGLWGMAAKKDLDAQGCKPNCPDQDVDRARVRFLAADIGLGVGAVSLGLATWFWFSRNDGTPPGKTAAIRLEPLGWNGVALRGAF